MLSKENISYILQKKYMWMKNILKKEERMQGDELGGSWSCQCEQ